MKKIIFDTNFLMAVGQFKVDIFSEIDRIADFSYNLYILDGSIDELEKIEESQTGKHKDAAKLALSLIKRLNVLKTKGGHVDDLLLEQDAIIATQDKELIKRLKSKGRNVIQLRKKQYLIIK